MSDMSSPLETSVRHANASSSNYYRLSPTLKDDCTSREGEKTRPESPSPKPDKINPSLPGPTNLFTVEPDSLIIVHVRICRRFRRTRGSTFCFSVRLFGAYQADIVLYIVLSTAY